MCEGGLDCWVYLSGLEVLLKCEQEKDSVNPRAQALNQAYLGDHVCKKVTHAVTILSWNSEVNVALTKGSTDLIYKLCWVCLNLEYLDLFSKFRLLLYAVTLGKICQSVSVVLVFRLPSISCLAVTQVRRAMWIDARLRRHPQFCAVITSGRSDIRNGSRIFWWQWRRYPGLLIFRNLK